MILESLKTHNRLILVVDHELSTFKGIARVCQDHNTEILYFSHRGHLIDWFDRNLPQLKSSTMSCCAIIEPSLADAFDYSPLADFLSLSPKICISRSSSAETVMQTARLGMYQYLPKPFTLNDIKITIERAFAFYEQGAVNHNRFKNLTKRERQTCELLAEGLPNKAIADRLGISIKTVKVHRANLMRKIEVKSIADLLRAFNTHQSLANTTSGISR